eukprot:533345-Rhodomonas_salina.2
MVDSEQAGRLSYKELQYGFGRLHVQPEISLSQVHTALFSFSRNPHALEVVCCGWLSAGNTRVEFWLPRGADVGVRVPAGGLGRVDAEPVAVRPARTHQREAV